VPLWLAASLWAADWPEFRGGNNGIAAKARPPLTWSETNHVKWQVHLPGRGRSSPVTLGHRLFLTTALETGVQRVNIKGDDMQKAEHVSLWVLGLDQRDGKILWQKQLFDVSQPSPVHWQNSWATPTPVVESGRVYADFGTYGTVCLDAKSGREFWRASLPVDHMVGPGSSPVVWKNLLILVRDGIDTQYVAALDKRTGRTAWRTERPPLHGGNALRKAFSTPIFVAHNGRTEAVIPGAQWVVAYDPASGRELWRVNHGEGFSFGTQPVTADGVVYVGTGLFHPQIWAIRLGGAGDVTQTHVAWKSDRRAPDMSSPVLLGEEIYWVSDNGLVSCSDRKSGAQVWQKSVGTTCLASPISAGGRLYVFERSGKTSVFKVGREMELLATNSVPGPLIATPAFVGQRIYLRTDDTLYCLEEAVHGRP